MSFKKLLFFLILFTNFFIKPAELKFINSSDKTLNVKLRGWKRMYGLNYRLEDLRAVKAGGALTWSTVQGNDIKKDEDINHTFFSRKPTGSSYYKLSQWVNGEKLTLEANASSVMGEPNINQLTSRFIADTSSQFLELIAQMREQ